MARIMLVGWSCSTSGTGSTFLPGGTSRRFDPTKGKAADEQAQGRKGTVIALTVDEGGP